MLLADINPPDPMVGSGGLGFTLKAQRAPVNDTTRIHSANQTTFWDAHVIATQQLVAADIGNTKAEIILAEKKYSY